MKEFKIQERIAKNTDVTNRYFNDINRISQITPAAEAILAEKAFNGDINARDELVKANLRFVISVAKAYYNGDDYKFEDLISEGNLGLIEAADTFDPSKGFKFISHAVWHIRKNIFKYLTDNTRHIRLPQSMVNSLSQMRKLEIELIQDLGREPSNDELIDAFIKWSEDNKGSTPRRINLTSALKADTLTISMDAPAPGTDSLTLIDILDGTDKQTDHLIDSPEARLNQLLPYVSKLRYNEQDIIRRRLGFDDAPLEFKEIAELYELGSEAIRVRFKNGIRSIRWRLMREKVTAVRFL